MANVSLSFLPNSCYEKKKKKKEALRILYNALFWAGLNSNIPPARAVNFWAQGAVGIFFNFYVFRNFKGWWARHNYVAFISPCHNLRSKGSAGPSWWGLWIVTTIIHWLHAPQLLELRLRGALFFEMLKEIAMTKAYYLHTYDISGPSMLMKMADEA